MLVKFMEL